MKKMTLFAAAALLLAGCSGRSLGIDTPDGKIVLTPLSENAVRVQMTGELDVPELEELIYDGETARVKYSVRRKDGVTSLKTAGMAVEYDAESIVCLAEIRLRHPGIDIRIHMRSEDQFLAALGGHFSYRGKGRLFLLEAIIQTRKKMIMDIFF